MAQRVTLSPSDLFEFSFGALKDRRLRSGLTILMVLVGASLVTSLNGMSQGMNGWVNQQLSSLAPNVVILLPAPRQPGGGPAIPTTTTFNEVTVKAVRGLPHVTAVIPFYRQSVKLNAGGVVLSQTMMGIEQDRLSYVAPEISVQDGRFVGRDDGLGILLGSKVAYPPGLSGQGQWAKVGQTILVEYTYVDPKTQKPETMKRAFQVRGILNELGSEFRDSTVYVSLSAANSFLQKGGRYDGLYIITSDPVYNDQIERTLLTTYGPNSIGILTPKSIQERVNTIIGGFSTFVTAIATISLVVGAVGIVTTLYTSVLERTREIGILKALGFDNRLVILLFLVEAASIGIIGGALGIVAGSLSANLVIKRLPLIQFQGRNLSAALTPTDLLTTFALSLAFSLIAGLYPAWRASKLDPVVALNRE